MSLIWLKSFSLFAETEDFWFSIQNQVIIENVIKDPRVRNYYVVGFVKIPLGICLIVRKLFEQSKHVGRSILAQLLGNERTIYRK